MLAPRLIQNHRGAQVRATEYYSGGRVRRHDYSDYRGIEAALALFEKPPGKEARRAALDTLLAPRHAQAATAEPILRPVAVKAAPSRVTAPPAITAQGATQAGGSVLQFTREELEPKAALDSPQKPELSRQQTESLLLLLLEL